jgi:2-octaprenyl-6-methoxyphenol hydroxylase
MNVCIIGDGLTSLSFAKNLINKKINVDIYSEKKINNLSENRTIGISKENFDFFNKEILKIQKKYFWEIKKIKIYSEKLKNGEILNFKKKKENLFLMIKNRELYKLLINKLLKSKFFKYKIIKKNNFYQKIINEKKYDLIINCNSKNFIARKYFSKKIDKKYNNFAYITILKHETINNKTAIQIFTQNGPIAFLPISNKETSVVYSVDFNKDKFDEKKIIDLIKKHNPKFIIKKIDKVNKFELGFSNLRNYYYQNILAFGDSLHKVHPLAGQGFNMIIRDIKAISQIIQTKIDLGIQLDASIFEEFEKKTKHVNFIFSNSIDSIYELFNFDKQFENKNFNKLLRILGKNKSLKFFFIKYADKGFDI